MYGPYIFNKNTIDKIINDDKIGNYSLGTKINETKLKVYYIGRSDTDLKSELLKRIKTHNHTHFLYKYASTSREAFEKECKDYHKFHHPKLENKNHPDRPNGSKLKCPIDGCEYNS